MKLELAKRARMDGFDLVLWSGVWVADRYFRSADKDAAVDVMLKGDVLMGLKEYIEGGFCGMLNELCV